MKRVTHFKDRQVRLSLNEDGRTLYCVVDILRIIKRPGMLQYKPIWGVCPLAHKRKIGNSQYDYWVATASDMKKYLKTVENENQCLYKACQEIYEWLDERENKLDKESNENSKNMDEIKIFQNGQFGQIRIVTSDNGEPLFCLTDVCTAIGIKDISRCASRLDDDLRQTHPIQDRLGRTQQATFVTESGLYDVIIRSDSEKAKPFRKWVTNEVLPSIRKHGAYMTNETLEKTLTDPDYLIKLATVLKEERQKRLEAEVQQKLLEEENSHKASVIEGLTEEIPLADMRQRITQIVRKAGGGNLRQAYNLLYAEFNAKYHINVFTRMNNACYAGSAIDYIEKELKQLPDLYDLACKLFESSYEKLMEAWGKSAKRAERSRNLNERQRLLS